ncbi:MAG: glycosyltransferase family 39 protein [Gemmatimonadales bacterium]
MRPMTRLSPTRLAAIGPALIVAWAGSQLLLLACLFANHLQFPLDLEILEGGMVQHIMRLVTHQPLYPAGSAEFVPFVYNPGYYLVAWPIVRLFGPALPPLRLFSMVVVVGCMVVLYLRVRASTGSRWWGFVTVGLFAAAYPALDAHLDSARGDGLMLFLCLFATWLLARARSWRGDVVAMLLLVLAFWVKQHGALFAAGGLFWLTWRHGLRRAWPSWLVVMALGPALYFLGGRALFGDQFLYFTWQLPSGWSEFSVDAMLRLTLYTARSFPLLFLASFGWLVSRIGQAELKDDLWTVQLLAAGLSAVMGALDRGSSDNVFIPFGTWLIVVAMPAIHAASRSEENRRQGALTQLVLAGSFLLLLYDPRPVAVSREAGAAGRDFASFIDHLPGTVCAPSLGYLPGGRQLYPAINWVALDDMIRGPRRTAADSARALALLEPILHPAGEAWLLTDAPVEESQPVLRGLAATYVLDQDLGDRFKALIRLPHRSVARWPRYLYRYRGGP